MPYGTPRAVVMKNKDGDEMLICVHSCVERLVLLGLIRFTSQYDQQTRYEETFGVARALASDKLAGIERPILEGQHQDELDKNQCDLCGKSLRIYCTDY